MHIIVRLQFYLRRFLSFSFFTPFLLWLRGIILHVSTVNPRITRSFELITIYLPKLASIEWNTRLAVHVEHNKFPSVIHYTGWETIFTTVNSCLTFDRLHRIESVRIAQRIARCSPVRLKQSTCTRMYKRCNASFIAASVDIATVWISSSICVV